MPGEIRFYDISRWGNFSRGDTIAKKKVFTGNTTNGIPCFEAMNIAGIAHCNFTRLNPKRISPL